MCLQFNAVQMLGLLVYITKQNESKLSALYNMKIFKQKSNF